MAFWRLSEPKNHLLASPRLSSEQTPSFPPPDALYPRHRIAVAIRHGWCRRCHCHYRLLLCPESAAILKRVAVSGWIIAAQPPAAARDATEIRRSSTRSHWENRGRSSFREWSSARVVGSASGKRSLRRRCITIRKSSFLLVAPPKHRSSSNRPSHSSHRHLAAADVLLLGPKTLCNHRSSSTVLDIAWQLRGIWSPHCPHLSSIFLHKRLRHHRHHHYHHSARYCRSSSRTAIGAFVTCCVDVIVPVAPFAVTK